MKIYLANKPIGQTPKEALLKVKKKLKLPQTATLSYAGRLDPMAYGLLLILQDANRTEWEKAIKLPKTYRTAFLFGIETDSKDLMGMPKVYKNQKNKMSFKNLLTPGTYHLPVPAFSSVPLNGKPLFYWARQGKLKKLTLPVRPMKITSVKYIRQTKISAGKLYNTLFKNITKVKGEFRQEKIINSWKKKLKLDCLISPVIPFPAIKHG